MWGMGDGYCLVQGGMGVKFPSDLMVLVYVVRWGVGLCVVWGGVKLGGDKIRRG